MNILFAWEIGLGLGHLARHLELAHMLHSRGHAIIFAVKDMSLASIALGRSGFAVIQAPHSPPPVLIGPPPCSHADLLVHHGMADSASCVALLSGWQRCFVTHRVDLVVIDHAPAALFAAKCQGIKTLELASGFCVPPAITPFPSFRPWESRSEADLLSVELKCLSAMNPFAENGGKKPFATLAQALAADLTLLTTFAELDHYPQRQNGRYIGPTESYAQGLPVTWRGNGPQRIFVYLHHIKQCDRLLSQLALLDAEVIAYCPDLTVSQQQALTTPRIELVAEPVAIGPLLETCDLAITNGGQGLVSACALHGVPLLVIPLHIEQRLMVDCLRRCGMGTALAQQDIDTKFKATVDHLLSSAKYRAAAQRLQHKYRSYNLNQTLVRLANTVDGLLMAAR